MFSELFDYFGFVDDKNPVLLYVTNSMLLSYSHKRCKQSVLDCLTLKLSNL